MKQAFLKRVSEGSGIPLYTQLYVYLRQRIENSEWKLGDQIPTIEMLMDEYSVSRITVRGAIERLEREGFVQRTQGRGTHVIKDLSQERRLFLPTTWEELVNYIEELNADVREIRSGVVDLLRPHRGKSTGRYWSSERVNYRKDKTPYSITKLYLAQRIFSLDPKSFRKAAILPLLRRMSEVRLAEAYQSLTIASADLATANMLELDAGDPIAEVRREALNEEGELIYFAEIQYPARHLCIESRLI